MFSCCRPALHTHAEVELQGLDVTYHAGPSYPFDERYGSMAPLGLSNAKEAVTVDMLHRILDEAMGSMERRLMPVRLLAEAKQAAAERSNHTVTSATSQKKVNKLRPLVEGEPVPLHPVGGSSSVAADIELGRAASSGAASLLEPSASMQSSPSGGALHRMPSSTRRHLQPAFPDSRETSSRRNVLLAPDLEGGVPSFAS